MDALIEDWSLLAAAGAAAVSVLSLLANVVLTRRGHRMQAEQLRIDIDAHLLDWAEDVLDVMGRASQLVSEPGAGDDGARSDILRDLSVLLDRGRWHAPNMPDPRHGADKPAAYRGYRQPALDCIFAVYEIVRAGEESPEAAADKIMTIRRHFVSEVQTLTDPRRRREFLRNAAAKKKI